MRARAKLHKKWCNAGTPEKDQHKPKPTLKPKNPSNEAELPLNQRQLAKQKLEKEGAKEKLKTNQKERKPKEQTTTRRHDKPNAKGKLKTCYTYMDKSMG